MIKKSMIVLVIVFLSLLVVRVSAESLTINVENQYFPGENVKFTPRFYNDKLEELNKNIDFKIYNYYTDLMFEGSVSSGSEVTYKLPENAVRGYWKIVVKSGDVESEALFNVMELEKAKVELEGDVIVVTNVGNVPYRKKISIQIGKNYQTALVALEIGQVKKIKLTAPKGTYDVKVSDGTKENTFEVKGVSLTGNVVGLEGSGSKSFWKTYPLVTLFLGIMMGLFIVVSVLRIMKKK